MKRAMMAAALLALAGCIAPPEGGPRSRKLNYGLFYEFLRPESSRQAEIRAKLDRPVAPEIDEAFDVSRIRASRTASEVPDDHEMRDWKDGVLLRADPALLRQMRGTTAARVARLEAKLASLDREPVSLTKGKIELVRHDLDVERTKLEQIDDRLTRFE